MAWGQYSSCRTVNRMGILAPALSQPSGQEFLCRNLGAVVFGMLAMALRTSTWRVGALRLWPAGQREGGDGAPPTGAPPAGSSRFTAWISGADRGIYEIRKRTNRSSANRGPEGTGVQKRWITGCKSRDCVQQSATRPLGLTTTYFELGSAALSQKAAARITGS